MNTKPSTITVNLCRNLEMVVPGGADCVGKLSGPSPLHESKTTKIPEFPLTLLQTQPRCEVYPDLHKIIQVWSAVSTPMDNFTLSLFLVVDSVVS